MRAGGCWRDLPERFGPYQTAKRRYYRWIAAVCSNSCWILREDRPFARRTKSLTEMYGGISTNIWTWSRDSTTLTMVTPNTSQTCLMISPTRKRPTPCSTLHRYCCAERQNLVEGKSTSERLELGGLRTIKKKKTNI